LAQLALPQVASSAAMTDDAKSAVAAIRIEVNFILKGLFYLFFFMKEEFVELLDVVCCSDLEEDFYAYLYLFTIVNITYLHCSGDKHSSSDYLVTFR
jgi:hypothetical protein